MSRRMPLLAALVAAVAIAACNSAPPAAPALTDPKEILTRSVTAMQDVKSFHIEAALGGTLNADLMGTGSSSAIKLDATSADADIDVANKKLRATFVVPAMFGLNGEVIQIGDTSYTKVSLAGDKYQKTEGAADDLPVDTDPVAALTQLNEFLSKPEIMPTKGADARCGEKDCYVVEIDLSAAELAALASSSPDEMEGFENGSIRLAISVQKDTLRLGRLLVTVAAGEMGNAELTVDFSRYDEAVSIEAPPADQVEE
jgi:hypothetical protein